MGVSEWIAFTGLIVAILTPAAMGIRRLGRIEANTKTHTRQIKALASELSETKSLVTSHAGTCDTDRGRLDERVGSNERRITGLETG